MTTQTRTFIELADIIGVRFECRTCGCSLSLDGDKDGATVDKMLHAENMVLLKCPTCGHPWTESLNRHSPFDSDIKELFRKLRDLKKIEDKFGCKITLEIAEPE